MARMVLPRSSALTATISFVMSPVGDIGSKATFARAINQTPLGKVGIENATIFCRQGKTVNPVAITSPRIGLLPVISTSRPSP